MTNRRSKIPQTKSFTNKLIQIVVSLGTGFFVAYCYVLEYDGTWPVSGTFYTFLKSSWFAFSPILIPIFIAAATSYLHRSRRSTDGN